MTLTTDGQRRTVIGVMPAGFTADRPEDRLLDSVQPDARSSCARRGPRPDCAIARLRDGVSFEQAYGEMRRHLR